MAYPNYDSGGSHMKAVITVIGRDMVGILAKVSALCAQHNINVTDVTQSVMQDLFAMIMLADISSMTVHFSELVDEMEDLGKEMGLSIHVMHEDIFNSMHRI
jgi:ACT domain-containing protein